MSENGQYPDVPPLYTEVDSAIRDLERCSHRIMVGDPWGADALLGWAMGKLREVDDALVTAKWEDARDFEAGLIDDASIK